MVVEVGGTNTLTEEKNDCHFLSVKLSGMILIFPSEATYYNWKAKYGGMGVSEIKRLKQLEDENRRLKQIVADLTLDNHALKAVLSKNF